MGVFEKKSQEKSRNLTKFEKRHISSVQIYKISYFQTVKLNNQALLKPALNLGCAATNLLANLWKKTQLRNKNS